MKICQYLRLYIKEKMRNLECAIFKVLFSHECYHMGRFSNLHKCTFKWDRPIRGLVSNCNPIWLWIPNVSQWNGRIKLNKELLKMFCDVVFVIFISSLFHSFITLGKKEFIKYSVLQLKDGIFLLFLVV